MTLESETPNTPNDNQIKESDEEPAVLIDAVDAVGQISPIVLIVGVLIGLILFIFIAGGMLVFVLSGGFGLVANIPDEPVQIDFESEADALWQLDSKTERDAEDQLYFTQQTLFEEGAYLMFSNEPNQIYWTTAGIALANGTYEVDVTFDEVKIDIGAGLAFLISGEAGAESFYLFEIDPNGFVWTGRCEAGCMSATPSTVGSGWYPVEAIKKGAGESNRLKVEVETAEIFFYINDLRVGVIENVKVNEWGDVGLLVESGDEGNMSARFDNFLWQPGK
ncbi:MAG: hypothetical protein AB8G95_07550 [Anaerolineae bacterium]